MEGAETSAPKRIKSSSPIDDFLEWARLHGCMNSKLRFEEIPGTLLNAVYNETSL